MTPELRKAVVALLRAVKTPKQGIGSEYARQYSVDIRAVYLREEYHLHPIWDMAVKARNWVQSTWMREYDEWLSYEECCERAAGLVEKEAWPLFEEPHAP